MLSVSNTTSFLHVLYEASRWHGHAEKSSHKMNHIDVTNLAYIVTSFYSCFWDLFRAKVCNYSFQFESKNLRYLHAPKFVREVDALKFVR